MKCISTSNGKEIEEKKYNDFHLKPYKLILVKISKNDIGWPLNGLLLSDERAFNWQF